MRPFAVKLFWLMCRNVLRGSDDLDTTRDLLQRLEGLTNNERLFFETATKSRPHMELFEHALFGSVSSQRGQRTRSWRVRQSHPASRRRRLRSAGAALRTVRRAVCQGSAEQTASPLAEPE